MSNIFSAIDKAPFEDLLRGYSVDEDGGTYRCLFCSFQVREGLVYPLEGGALAEAGFAMKNHIQTEHGSSLEALLTIDSKVSGLTEIQRQVYLLLAQGKGDQEVAQLTGKAASTIRNHRYNLRERGREAKVLAAIAQMLAPREKEDFVQYPESLTVRDERTIITTAEHDQVIAKFFGGKDGKRLIKFPKKEKQKLVILDALSRRFEQRVTYKESEINDILQESYDDYVTLRRYLIEYGFLNRDPGGVRYWRVTPGFVPEQA